MAASCFISFRITREFANMASRDTRIGVLVGKRMDVIFMIYT